MAKDNEDNRNFQAPSGCVFVGWLDEGDPEDETDDRIYHFGDKIENVNRDITLKAVWEPAAKVKIVKTTEGLDDLSMEMLDYHDHFTLTADEKEHGLINWSSEEYEADGVKGVRWIGEPIQRLADAANCTLEEISAPHISGYCRISGISPPIMHGLPSCVWKMRRMTPPA